MRDKSVDEKVIKRNLVYDQIQSGYKKPTFIRGYENFDSDAYNKGLEWFNSGLSFEEAPDNLKNNSAFRDGFARGKRLELIQQLLKDDSNSKKR